MRIALAQMNQRVGDLAGNAAAMLSVRARAAEQGADLVLTPEMQLPGYPVEDLVLKPEFVRRVHECTDQLVAATVEQLLAQPAGDERWESVHYAPNRDAEGNVIGIYMVHADIHDQKRNEDELKRANWMLSSHISNTPLAVLEWDRDFRLVRWSPQAENIFGWKSEEILGVPPASAGRALSRYGGLQREADDAEGERHTR